MCVIYHWWNDEELNLNLNHYSNLSHPILLSIATLRSVNPNIPIKVLDYSKKFNDCWAHFKEKLNFSVVHKNEFYLNDFQNILGYQLLSRLFDVNRNCQDLTIYCDSDVFWLRDPLPLNQNPNKFCFDGFNSGFFYFNHESDAVQKFFKIFESFTITCLLDKKFCQIVKEATAYNAWPYIWDETIMTYMTKIGVEPFFKLININEHGVLRNILNIDPKKCKMLHCNGLLMKNPMAKKPSELEHSRGLVCLFFKEFYERITSVLNENDLKMIFTEIELNYCLSNQISLFDIKEIQKHKMSDGHFVFQGTPSFI